MVPFKCDVHGWMSAYVGVLDHPYFGTTAPDGTVVLGNLPPGTYTIEAWHEPLGTKTQQVTIGAERIEGCQLHLRTLTRRRRVDGRDAKAHSRAGDFVTLTKPRLNFLVLLTTAAAYSLGAGSGRHADRSGAHAARHVPRRRRRRGAQPGVGAAHRSADAAHAAAADGRRCA